MSISNESALSRLADADMQAAPAALLRAARRARELARQTDTAVVYVRNGHVVEETMPVLVGGAGAEQQRSV
jgi:hypothetical protein